MSELLTDLIKKRKDDALTYAEYLEKIAELVRAVKAGHGGDCPATINTPGRKALYDNLGRDEARAQSTDQAIRKIAQIGWRGNKMKERMIRRKLSEILEDEDAIEQLTAIIRAHDEY